MGDYFFAQDREQTLSMLTDQRPVEALPFEERVLSVRERSSEWLDQSGVRKVLDFLQIFMSLLACIVYVVSTYGTGDLGQWTGLLAIEITFGVFFSFDFLLTLFLAENKIKFLTSVNAVVDLLTILPVFVPLVFERSTDAIINLGILRVVRVLRVLRVLRVYRIVKFSSQGYRHQQLVLVFTLTSLIFCATGIVHAVETENQYLPFHRAFYYVIVTISTVGYGDISPMSTLGEWVIIGIILLTAFIIPQQMSELRSFNVDDAEVATFDDHSGNGHVIYTGDTSLEAIDHFVSEFFHNSHGKQVMSVVAIGMERPSSALKNYLRANSNGQRVTYLQGTVLRDLDLNRARASEARAAFIVADKKCRDAAREDSLNTMSAAAIRNLCLNLPIFAQILDESARQHMEWAIADKGQVVSLSQWKYRMLGRTPMCPGVSTMVANIVESHTRWVPEGFPISHWFEEYAHGLAHEVYPIVLTRAFKGLTFAEAVRRIFQQFSVVLLGVVQDGQVALNPQGSVLEEGMVSFVLAHSARLAHLISTGFSPDDLVTLSSDVRGAAVFANNDVFSASHPSLARMRKGSEIDLATIQSILLEEEGEDDDTGEAEEEVQAEGVVEERVAGEDAGHAEGGEGQGEGSPSPGEEGRGSTGPAASAGDVELQEVSSRGRGEGAGEAHTASALHHDHHAHHARHSHRGSDASDHHSHRRRLHGIRSAAVTSYFVGRGQGPPPHLAHCHLRHTFRPQERAMFAVCPARIRSSVLVMVGATRELRHLLPRLRSRTSGSMRPIVLLTSSPVPPHIWADLGWLKHVFVVVGDTTSSVDLLRAGAHHASSVIVTSPAALGGEGEEGEALSGPAHMAQRAFHAHEEASRRPGHAEHLDREQSTTHGAGVRRLVTGSAALEQADDMGTGSAYAHMTSYQHGTAVRRGVDYAFEGAGLSMGEANAVEKATEALVDSTVLRSLSALALALNRDCRVCAELRHSSSVHFARPRYFMKNPPHEIPLSSPMFSPVVASGRVLLTNALDSAIVQCFYNPYLQNLIQALLSGRGPEEEATVRPTESTDADALPHFDGDAESSDSSDEEREGEGERAPRAPAPAPARRHSARRSSDRFARLSMGSRSTAYLPTGIIEIGIPLHYVGMAYAEVFESALQQGFLPLGLYRCPQAHATAFPYVFTNPGPQTRIVADDRLFTLSSAAKAAFR